MLTPEELEAKIGSANQVLAAAAATVDGAQGPGRGRAVVEGVLAASGERAWLAVVDVSADGTLVAGDVWDALHPFSPDLRRDMLNRALVELLEGVLSHSALD